MPSRFINWSPTPGEDPVQCVRTLIKTEPGTVPLARALGVPQDAVDSPTERAGARLQADVITAVRRWEPRVKVERVRLVASADGTIEAVAELVGA